MQNLPKEFINWYESLKMVKANKGPANGSIATALVVLNRLQAEYILDFNEHVADGGMQIRGASGSAVSAILKNFGEDRPFAKEGGRTNRGGPSEVKELLLALSHLQLDQLNKHERNSILIDMQSFLVERVKDYHNRQKIRLLFNPDLSTWYIIHNLLQISIEEGKAGYIAQHLIGAKLQLRFPNIEISNQSASTADMQTNRPGDFLIGQTAFHVTVAPMPAVFEKCKYNITQGYKPFLIVPDSKLIGARQNAEQFCQQQIAVESIESFVSQNIEEISGFNKNVLGLTIKDLVKIYNRRVDSTETDKSLMIELPSNLL
ncbi:DUF4928 domain-containing protein [Mucilaginibacter terrigena]|uniref:DUF4928 domain-containing protein n=1 Tax=Mucilaginibacter terrigena TaxID=2492395 RepID=A0A4Q5LMU4_9SPHI|nr:DUF4928 family protein [Mucilaginibacter terrigena]RYU89366.1 DUF4928 domain-containing protein [Mucilaginibacter terrigena]